PGTVRPRASMARLRAALSDAYARAALDGPPGAQPSEEALHHAVQEALVRDLSPAQEKLLLGATLAHFDPHSAAGHLSAALPADPGETSSGAMTVEQLEELTPELWRACLTWLLAVEGYSAEEVGHDEESVTWRGHTGASPVLAHAVRLPRGWLLDEEAVQRAAALVAAGPAAQLLLLSTSQASVTATLAARRLNVQLWAQAR